MYGVGYWRFQTTDLLACPTLSFWFGLLLVEPRLYKVRNGDDFSEPSSLVTPNIIITYD